MTIKVGTNISWTDGFDSYGSLPLNYTSNVRLEVAGPYVILYLNNTVDNFHYQGGVRESGKAILFFHRPLVTSAIASIGPIQMTPISAIQFVKPSDYNGVLSKIAAYEETVDVPVNYSLSFSITPTGTVSDWANIIHCSGDKSDIGTRGRMPGILLSHSY